MITEPGKYKTRDGRIAIIEFNFTGYLSRSDLYSWKGYLDANPRTVLWWNDQGKNSLGLCEGLDIVEKVFVIDELGWYKTRDGQLAEVTDLNNGNRTFVIEGKIQGDSSKCRTWTKTGEWTKGKLDVKDLVEKASPPKSEATSPKVEIPEGYIAYTKNAYIVCDSSGLRSEYEIYENCTFVFINKDPNFDPETFRNCKFVDCKFDLSQLDVCCNKAWAKWRLEHFNDCEFIGNIVVFGRF